MRGRDEVRVKIIGLTRQDQSPLFFATYHLSYKLNKIF